MLRPGEAGKSGAEFQKNRMKPKGFKHKSDRGSERKLPDARLAVGGIADPGNVGLPSSQDASEALAKAGIVRGRGKPEGAEAVEEVISINRITKVTKGGKKLSFSALVVVGDTKGRVGYGLEKAAEVSIAIRKAIASAKKDMVRISLKGTTIPHEIIGRCGGARVLLKPASDGTGVIAAGPVRAVCDGVGIRNILTKCHRSNNPINVVKATLDGLNHLKAMS